MEHYYTKVPSSETNRQVFEAILRESSFKFLTDNGVFSKGEVDFGSKLLIETFSEPEIHGTIVDVGCGYGAIGLSLAKAFPHRTIEMVDVNERAISLTKENKHLNKLENVTIYESDCLTGVSNKQIAVIITNPPIRAGKKVVHAIFEQSAEKLSTGGELWLVIQKKQGAPSTIEKLNILFSTVEVIEKKKGYYIIKAEK